MQRPLTPKSMPPTNAKHTKPKATAPNSKKERQKPENKAHLAAQHRVTAHLLSYCIAASHLGLYIP